MRRVLVCYGLSFALAVLARLPLVESDDIFFAGSAQRGKKKKKKKKKDNLRQRPTCMDETMLAYTRFVYPKKCKKLGRGCCQARPLGQGAGARCNKEQKYWVTRDPDDEWGTGYGYCCQPNILRSTLENDETCLVGSGCFGSDFRIVRLGTGKLGNASIPLLACCMEEPLEKIIANNLCPDSINPGDLNVTSPSA